VSDQALSYMTLVVARPYGCAYWNYWDKETSNATVSQAGFIGRMLYVPDYKQEVRIEAGQSSRPAPQKNRETS